MSVYFNDSTSKDQIFALQNILLTRSDIKSVEYVSKEKALEIWRERYKNNEKIRNAVNETDNPLPRSLEIKTERPEDLDQINTFLTSADYKPMIRDISYANNKVFVDRLVKITKFAENTGWIVSSIFLVIAILIIYNAVGLAINSRSEEIEIMRLVGASDWYVQGPFFVEGAAYGLLGSFFSSVVSFLIIRVSFPAIVNYLGSSNANVIYSGVNYWIIFGAQLLAGLILGISCSLIAVRKYLKR
jgi:cell division transport system permease protein